MRFYLATIAPETKDSDFSFKGYQDTNNGMLAAIYGNFVNRCLAFINKFFSGRIEGDVKYMPEDDDLWKDVDAELKTVLECYETFRVRDAANMLTDKRYLDLTMDEIGRKAGFANRQSFYAAFFKEKGEAPHQYKKRLLSK